MDNYDRKKSESQEGVVEYQILFCKTHQWIIGTWKCTFPFFFKDSNNSYNSIWYHSSAVNSYKSYSSRCKKDLGKHLDCKSVW